jgi:hypothetical protein
MAGNRESDREGTASEVSLVEKPEDHKSGLTIQN